MTDPATPMPRLEDVREALHRLEPLFHRPDADAGPDAGERLTEPGFWEVGASGRRYPRDYVLAVLAERGAHPADDPWRVEAFECHPLAPGLYLLHYVLHQGARVTRRTTLWRRTVDGWKAVFHQGTPLAEA